MPGWHERTLQFQQDRRLQLVGIIQEQHPDRARLFMQWKQMEWPILVDSLNLLGVSAVPITLLIDEAGIIRVVNPTSEELEQFMERPGRDSDPRGETGGPPDLAALAEAAVGDPDAALGYADALFLWGGEAALDSAVETYQAVLERNPGHAPAAFRLGVALRRRYDSGLRQAEDFQRAVQSWRRALDLNPNQYVWRRRIQQYGARLDKPYPFYDWVHRARQEIRGRGEEPVSLLVEPSGAEFAQPADRLPDAGAAPPEPDPRYRIHPDDEGFFQLESTLVPDRLEPGGAARVHLVFRPNQEIRAHWNNEVAGLVVWLRPESSWEVDSPHHEVAGPAQPTSLETRRVEFEVQAPDGFSGGGELAGYALYYVCEDVNGTCLYRRQDFSIPIQSRPRK